MTLHLDRLVLLSGIFLSVFAIAASSTGGMTPSPWHVYFQSPVTLNNPLIGYVQGPPHSNFTLYLYAQPFNTSSPILSIAFNLTGNQTNRTIEIPTGTLSVGSYEIAVDTVTQTLTQIVRIIDAINATQILTNISVLQSQQIALEGQIQGEQGKVNQVQGQLYYAIYVVIFAMIYVTVIDSVKAFVVRKPGAMRRVRKSWTNFWEELPYRTHAKGWEPLDTVVAATPDPERIWVSGFCDKCYEILWTESGIRQHIVEDHEIPKPERNYDYWMDAKAVNRVRESDLPDPVTRTAARSQSWDAGLDDIGRRPRRQNNQRRELGGPVN